MRRAFLAPLPFLLIACGARYRTETLGTGTANAGSVTVPAAGLHDVQWTITVPQAMRVSWAVTCGGAEQVGVAGETFDAYRERRIAELRAEREQEKRTVASLAGAVAGGVGVATPAGEAHAEVGVNGEAVADAIVSDDVQLSPYDTGAGTYSGHAQVVAAAPGACTMTLAAADEGADVSAVTGMFTVTRQIDTVAERRVARAELRAAAGTVRADVTAALVASGADPELRVRAEADARARADADAQARLEIEYRAEAERNARLQVEADARAVIWTGAITARGAQLSYLAGVCGADPYHRERVAQERAAHDERLRVEAEARAELRHRQRAAYHAEIDRRYQLALIARADVLAYLRYLGAVEKPPMPDPVDEYQGEPPMDGAIWIAGEWIWRGGAWIWVTGGWTIPDVTPVVVEVDDDRPAVRDHRDGEPDRAKVEDHRDEPKHERPETRDHRDEPKSDPPPRDERPTTRDHRDSDRDDGKVHRRDHR